jgi:SAM-dependent methyltransferase|tara:strand:- start:791 stop:1282 length:492 start_codon:yes stop_codon:yes gene_type:complete
MEVITYGEEVYPHFQAAGNASQFAIPFAKHLCKGEGLDIGCNRKEWAFPGAQPIDLLFDDEWEAYNLPDKKYDYIFSSHCLEHLSNWVDALDNWKSHLRAGGVLFLYLPHYDQKYWRPWNNRKHIHAFVPEVIVDYLKDRNFNNIFCSERDLNHSFIVVGEKA